MCLLFFLLHLFASVWKVAFGTSTFWLTSIFLSLASSIFSFGFEAWMVVEHDKVGLEFYLSLLFLFIVLIRICDDNTLYHVL